MNSGPASDFMDLIVASLLSSNFDRPFKNKLKGNLHFSDPSPLSGS